MFFREKGSPAPLPKSTRTKKKKRAACVRFSFLFVCVLEKAKKVEQTFKNPYYKKESWSLPLHPETAPTGVNPYREDFLDKHYPGIRKNEYQAPNVEQNDK